MRKLLVRSSVAGLIAASFLVAGAGGVRRDGHVQGRPSRRPPKCRPTDSKGSGALTATYDTGEQEADLQRDLQGPDRSRDGGAFPRPGRRQDQCRRRRAGAGAGERRLASPLKGEATLTDAQAADLAAGKWYFNVHTAANKGGEIRGQVMKGGM